MSSIALARVTAPISFSLASYPHVPSYCHCRRGAGGLELATRLGKTLGKRGIASVMLVDANLTHI